MNISLLLLLIPPILVVLGFKIFKHQTICWKEMVVQAVVSLALVLIVWNISQYSQFADNQILNGKVIGKNQVRVSCEHSYQCNCRTVYSGTGKNRTSSRRCDTCYRHFNDWDWRVYTTLGEFNIDRVDSRGSDEPHRWSLVEKDQPMAKSAYYKNYIRAAPDSIFHFAKAAAYKGPLPPYPQVYDYQYADRVLVIGKDIPDLKLWNNNLARSLNDTGARKQANINLVFTDKTPIFADALRAEWLGGKKNDVTIVVGTSYPVIRWVKVFSWAKHDIINVSLRNDLLESRVLDPVSTIALINKDINAFYERKPMEDFAYLAQEAVPSVWVMVVAFILSVGASVGLGLYFHHNDPFK